MKFITTCLFLFTLMGCYHIPDRYRDAMEYEKEKGGSSDHGAKLSCKKPDPEHDKTPGDVR